MLNNPTVSVIIPVFNGNKHILSCLEAILASDYKDFECIIVDDGSKDNTVSISRGFSASGGLQAKVLTLPNTYGPAYARNRGVEVSGGRILLFVDVDVVIRPDTITRIVEDFKKMPCPLSMGAPDAVFGSYDDAPGAANFLSQYKNLFHHYIHQQGREDALTFWCGCGAIKRDVFIKFGGFNENFRFIEDIELGYRLWAAHQSIYLDKSLLVKHLKQYTFLGLLKSDIFGRAIPWSTLMLSSSNTVNDLNIKTTYKVSLCIVMLLMGSLPFVGTWWGRYPFILLFSVFYLLHRNFYNFFIKKRGLLFALRVIPLHLLYYLYSGFSFMFSALNYLINKKKLKENYERDSFSKFVFVK